MYTLLDSCLDRLDIFEFLNHVEDGLKDHYDIKMLTYLMLVRLSHLCPSAVLQSKYSQCSQIKVRVFICMFKKMQTLDDILFSIDSSNQQW